MLSALEEACRKFGGSAKLASALKRSKGTLSRWKQEQIPAEMCPPIERLTGVYCERLRPDVEWEVLVLRNSKRRPSKQKEEAA